MSSKSARLGGISSLMCLPQVLEQYRQCSPQLAPPVGPRVGAGPVEVGVNGDLQLIWADHDPVGTSAVAQAAARLMPRARLELLPAGHVPYLGHPQRVRELLSTFNHSP